MIRRFREHLDDMTQNESQPQRPNNFQQNKRPGPLWSPGVRWGPLGSPGVPGIPWVPRIRKASSGAFEKRHWTAAAARLGDFRVSSTASASAGVP